MTQSAPSVPLLDTRKFRDPDLTVDGARRARVDLKQLETLWINTGTLCNLTCVHCYIESSPRNDRLVYITAAEVAEYLDEIERDAWGTTTIGFTGGEPFMNPDFPAMLADALVRGFEVLVLTNAMKPMMKQRAELLVLRERYGTALTLRVSIDHYTQAEHETERGRRTWAPTIEGLQWLSQRGFMFSVAGRMLSGETETAVREGFVGLFTSLDIALDARDPSQLMVFPEMDAEADVPEITTDCWHLLGKSPEDVMCSSSRMVVKRKGAAHPAVVSCTLLPYDEAFELGCTLAEANQAVPLNHPHCARFCVLGGASCSQ